MTHILLNHLALALGLCAAVERLGSIIDIARVELRVRKLPAGKEQTPTPQWQHSPLQLGRCVLKVKAMNTTAQGFVTGLADERGVTAIEYGLLAALIAVTIIGGVSATGTSLTALFNTWSAAVIGAL
jgi:pilus assembly protein Flp/PilA